MHARLTLAVLALALGLAALPVAAQAKTKPKPPQRYLVSLGDSYASGFQATGQGQGHNTRHGFAYQIPALAAKRGYNLKLVNFGCGGATTTSILQFVGCPPGALGPGGRSYPTRTQAAAAERFLRANRAKTTLVTVSIGGNDVTACVRDPDPQTCVVRNVDVIKRNLATLVTGLRAAAGPHVRIVGITYPDVILGLYTTGQQSDKDLANTSLFAFRALINPALKSGYQSVGGKFVDVTAATGAYGSLTQTTTLAPYGVLPVPVAKVCKLTYFCQFRDIHMRTPGYGIIAKLVANTLPRRT